MSGFGGNLLCNGVYCYQPTGGRSPRRRRVCCLNTRRSFAGCSAVDLRGGGPLYAGGGRTPRKGGVVLASATSFSPFSHLFRALVANLCNQSIAIFTVYSHNLFTYRLGSLRTRSGPHRAISLLLRRARGGKNIYTYIIIMLYIIIQTIIVLLIIMSNVQ